MSDARVKVHFRLETQDGVAPPVSVESVWAHMGSAGLLVLDNVPFLAFGATRGDAVTVVEIDGKAWFEAVKVASTNSLVRALVKERKHRVGLQEDLTRLGCTTEWFDRFSILAVSVSSAAMLDTATDLLAGAEREGWLEYQEVIVR